MYGQDTANDTLFDYGCVLTPDIFESKKSFNEALNNFANTIRNHFGGSSFYNNRDNANYVARSYMMAKKMCENSQFSDITDIYACDMDVVSHTYEYDSSNIILLADTQVVQLNDSYGEDCDTDQDDLNDNVEAHTPEEVDITKFLEVYCDYNKYTPEEKADMIEKNSKVIMYNYSSNPALPDSDFDGRNDFDDGRKLDNEYDSMVETNNYSNLNIKFNQDYRYFFMDSTKYYPELAEMGMSLSNMVYKKLLNFPFSNTRIYKKWKNNNVGENRIINNIIEYMWYFGFESLYEHLTDYSNFEHYDVPYVIGHHDVIALQGKVNNLERNVITLVIGDCDKESSALGYLVDLITGNVNNINSKIEYYKNEADNVYQALVDYDNSQTADRWKKSYWIVGYGSGGSIANLVAKKFIDYKYVNTNIYCYTYQSPNTINRNNLTKRIYNTKYQSIFNIENTDDIMLNLMGDEAGWTKYGVLKRLSVGDDAKIKQSWNSLTHDSYKSSTNFVYNLLAGLYNANDGMVSGFSNTEISILEKRYGLDENYIVLAYLATDLRFINPMLSLAIRNRIGILDNITIYGTNLYLNFYVASGQCNDETALDRVLTYNLVTKWQPIIDLVRSSKVGSILNYIDELGPWYVNHVATYGSKMKGSKDYYNNATTLAQKYLNHHALVEFMTNTYTINAGDRYKSIK